MPRMKTYASFDEYLQDQTAKNRSIIRALRTFVRMREPELVETVKWGNGCWVRGNEPVAYVHSEPGFVQFGFFRGSSLQDPQGLLEGSGRYVRHVKVRAPTDIRQRGLGALLTQAARSKPRTGRRTG